MPQSVRMKARVVFRAGVWLALLLALGDASGKAQSGAETDGSVDSFRVYTERPRLFLRAQRLRLLRRERERNSLRWEQFHADLAAGPMAEPGFANALEFRIADDQGAGRRAIEWALGANRDPRQMAMVYDWCQDLLSAAEKQKLLDQLRRAAKSTGSSVSDLRTRTLAAVAIAGDDDAASEAALRRVMETDWKQGIVRQLKAGKAILRGEDNYALFEMFHAVRDNLNMDLREDYPEVFHDLPLIDLLSYYPPPWPAPDNEFHIPYSRKIGEPDLRIAALSRAGELAMVAFDTNAPASQVLQGWLMNDHFLMRGPFGIPYEFLWANPYQPGLSYYHVPLVLHDELFGRLLVRSSWEDDANWAGYLDGQLQEFRDGHVVPLDPKAQQQPIDLDEAAIFFPAQAGQFETGKKEANDTFVVGLAPKTAFHVEVDDEEMTEMDTDPGGILYLKGVRPQIAIRVNRESSAAGPAPATSQ